MFIPRSSPSLAAGASGPFVFRVGLLDTSWSCWIHRARYTLQARDFSRGEVAERLKAAVLKTARVKALVGSNPTLSATPLRPANPVSSAAIRWGRGYLPPPWRGGRVAEGAPLLRVYGFTLIEGSNPSLSANTQRRTRRRRGGSKNLVFPERWPSG